ncbi:hypothetical protein ACFL4L_01280 [bacterium]
MPDQLRLHLVQRFIIAADTILCQKQIWLLERESYQSEEKKSILFLYPTVINTYNTIYSPRFEQLFRNVTVEQMVVLPKLN